MKLMRKPSTPRGKMLLTVGIIFVLLFGWYGIRKIGMIWFMSRYQPPAVTVSANTAKAEVWQSYLTSVGTLSAINGVDISSEVPGKVSELHFQSGQFVKAGDILVLLDTSIEQASLKDNQAKLKLAQINYDRDKKLFDKNVVSQSALDTTTAQLEQAQAGLESVQASIKQKTITAPFDGKIGIRLVDLGEYVSPGAAMVTLQSLNPLYVKFSLPEQNLGKLYLQQPVDISVNLGSGKIIHGTVTAINSKVDQTTRNILVEATLPNDQLQLYPGMFAMIKVWLKEQTNVITLPETAIAYSLYGDYVFLITSDNKNGEPVLHVTRQFVVVGEHRGDQVAILKGVKAGDQVVSSGQLKLQNGATVVINNNVEL